MYDETNRENESSAAEENSMGGGEQTNVSGGESQSETSGSEYRFTGPFYSDNDDTTYSRGDTRENRRRPHPGFEAGGTQYDTPVKGGRAKKKRRERGAAGGSFGNTLLKTVCIAVVFGIIAGGAFAGVNHMANQYYGTDVQTKTEEKSELKTSDSTATGGVNTINNSIDVRTIAKDCMPSIVSINNNGVQEVRSWFGTYSQQVSSSGSGIIIGKNDTELQIVTNYHVVSGSSDLSVYFSFEDDAEEKNVVSAKIKGYDSQKDLAVIAVALSDIPEDTLSKVVIATIGDSSQLEIGQQVVAIGNAMGYGQSVTTGIISALNRDVTVQNEDGSTVTNKLIQTDAAINPGNSGGALISMDGEVIGINAVKFSSEEVEGMGYAIPVSDVESIIGDLMNKETRDKVADDQSGYLGISCVDVTSDVSQMYGMPMGVYVSSVVEGSAADQAGIKKGDVLVKFAGSSIASYAELQDALQYYGVGETVEVVIKTQESGEYVEKTVSVTLTDKDKAGIK